MHRRISIKTHAVPALAMILTVIAMAAPLSAHHLKIQAGSMPVTTSSVTARALYLKGITDY
jgi:hypothetical protein